MSQSQRMTAKHCIAVTSTVQKANIPHNGVEALSGRCQFRHCLGGSASSNMASIMADKIKLPTTASSATLKYCRNKALAPVVHHEHAHWIVCFAHWIVC